jgi:hypothetical protein
VANGYFQTAYSDEERKVLALMKQVRVITSHVPGSAASRLAMRNEIQGMIMEHGLPNFYVTINPADVYNPIVKFLAGSDINLDDLLPSEVPDFWQQSILVAKNPMIAARFFNMFIKTFLSCVLGYDSKDVLHQGVLGVTKGYYGCVEAQGRGTLHCHMVIWLEGGLNCDEIKKHISQDGDAAFHDRLLAFLDDSISNGIPPDPGVAVTHPLFDCHPCAIRGIPNGIPEVQKNEARQKDLHNLASKCQRHRHTATCFKYWRGPPEPKECRFDLDESHFCSTSTFDSCTGELELRCLDGMVNNFNETILELMRCNMDIKFIGSGASTKAVLYYITDYITKSQLKSHVAFAALGLAVSKLGEYNPQDDDLMFCAKRLLQCAYAMISHQELSAQQVSSYLLNFEDHFTSHQFAPLFWMMFEREIERDDPSPECSVIAPHIADSRSIVDLEIENVDSENVAEDNLGDEIGVSVTKSGNLLEQPSQLTDYQLRNDRLQSLCLAKERYVNDHMNHISSLICSAAELH